MGASSTTTERLIDGESIRLRALRHQRHRFAAPFVSGLRSISPMAAALYKAGGTVRSGAHVVCTAESSAG